MFPLRAWRFSRQGLWEYQDCPPHTRQSITHKSQSAAQTRHQVEANSHHGMSRDCTVHRFTHLIGIFCVFAVKLEETERRSDEIKGT